MLSTIALRLRCGGSVVRSLLQIYCWVSKWENFKNRSAFWENTATVTTVWLMCAGWPAAASPSAVYLTVSQALCLKTKNNVIASRYQKSTVVGDITTLQKLCAVTRISVYIYIYTLNNKMLAKKYQRIPSRSITQSMTTTISNDIFSVQNKRKTLIERYTD